MERSEAITETDLIKEIERQQRATAAESPATAKQVKPRVVDDFLEVLSPAEEARRLEIERQRELQRERGRRLASWQSFLHARGSRYQNATLDTFVADTPKQVAAVEALREYSADIVARIESGEGIVLFGPKGTGKDHLLVALCRTAIEAGKTVHWQNGMDLFGEIRDRMDGGESERQLINKLVSPEVLYLSDPVPPVVVSQDGKSRGGLTEFQAAMMFRILDGRYSRNRSTWCSVNVGKGTELEDRMGTQNVDRLRDGALSIHCDWPSHRVVSRHVTVTGTRS